MAIAQGGGPPGGQLARPQGRQRQGEGHQAAGQPGEQVVEAGAGGAEPAQPAAPIAHHRIEGAGGLEDPGQAQRAGGHGGQPRRDGAHQHPEQRREQPIHRILRGRFRGGPHDAIPVQTVHIPTHDPGQPLAGLRRVVERRQHVPHRPLQAAARQGTGQADQQQRHPHGGEGARQLLQAPARQRRHRHHGSGHGCPSDAQPGWTITRPAFPPLATRIDQQPQGLYRMGPGRGITDPAIEHAGQGHQQPGLQHDRRPDLRPPAAS